MPRPVPPEHMLPPDGVALMAGSGLMVSVSMTEVSDADEAVQVVTSR